MEWKITIYQHDNSRYHSSKQTQTKLRELGVRTLDWPEKSPDINVIEHLWSIIDEKLKARPMSSIKELIEALSTNWLSIKPELCKILVFSMPHKIYKCIKRQGKSIDF
jgi:transposase